jgi:hypothetical protein
MTGVTTSVYPGGRCQPASAHLRSYVTSVTLQHVRVVFCSECALCVCVCVCAVHGHGDGRGNGGGGGVGGSDDGAAMAAEVMIAVVVARWLCAVSCISSGMWWIG